MSDVDIFAADLYDEDDAERSPTAERRTRKSAPHRFRHAQVTWANTIAPKPVQWFWQDEHGGRIPAGSLSVAAGREGTGKSSFGLHLAAELTQGRLQGVYAGRPRNVLYVAVEDSWAHTLVPRLIAAGADLSKVGRFDIVSDEDEHLTLSLPTDLDTFEETINENGVGLVIVDPLISAFGGSIDTHREADVRKVLDPLARIADSTGAVILGIAHFSKASGRDPSSLIVGSGAFKNVPRSVFGFARDKDEESDVQRVLSQEKNSLGRDDLPSLTYTIDGVEVCTDAGPTYAGRFRFTGVSDRSVAEVLRDVGGPGDDDRSEVQAFIFDYLSQRTPPEAPAGEVLRAGRAAGFSDQSMKNARKRMKNPDVSTVKASFGGGWVWALDSQGVTEGAEGTRAQSPDTFDTFAVPSASATSPAAGSAPASDLFSTPAADSGEPDADELNRRYREAISR